MRKSIPFSPGDSGSDVSSLQRRLKALNYFDGNVTGFFGKRNDLGC